ncbi:MAG: CopG family transcriptional regulator [Candidatus Micrarchaeia archaeon]
MDRKRGLGVQSRKYTTITIPAPLFSKIKKIISKTGFSSVSDYVTYVMRETVAEIESKGKGRGEKSGIAEKLKALGYL